MAGVYIAPFHGSLRGGGYPGLGLGVLGGGCLNSVSESNVALCHLICKALEQFCILTFVFATYPGVEPAPLICAAVLVLLCADWADLGVFIPIEGNLGIKAIKAELSIPSNSSSLFVVHASPPGTVGRVITLMRFIQVLVVTLEFKPHHQMSTQW